MTKLIDEDKGVLTRIGGIVLLPSISWVVGIEGKGNGVIGGQSVETGGFWVSQGKRDSLRDGRLLWLLHVIDDDVSDVRDEEEVYHVVIMLDRDLQMVIVQAFIGECRDVREEGCGPCGKRISDACSVLHGSQECLTVETHLFDLLQCRNAFAECLSAYQRGGWRVQPVRSMRCQHNVLETDWGVLALWTRWEEEGRCGPHSWLGAWCCRWLHGSWRERGDLHV